MQDKYYELQLKINPDMEDIISEICFEVFPCEGVVLAEETYKDLEMVSTTEGTLRVFLTEKVEVEKVLKKYRTLLISRGFTDEELGSWEYTFAEKDNEDWSKKWKEKWDVTHVSERITVVPDWIEYTPKKENEVVIRLEPGCAFGTGTHQTTQLCMKAMEKYLKPNMTVADIGMGSGILSICAIKMGAKFAYGCDIDETVIDVAKENAIKNGVNIIKDRTQKLPDYREYFENNPKIKNICASDYPPLEGGSKSSISGWGKSLYATHKFPHQNQQLAKYMRNNPTDAEYKLWYYLKNSGIGGIKFRRQQAIGNYIVDFVSFQKKIIIELDGGQHSESSRVLNDVSRDKFLINAGYRVLRFWNDAVLNNIDSVLDCIFQAIQQTDPTPKLLDYREYMENNPNYNAILTLPQGEGIGYFPLDGESKAMLSQEHSYLYSIQKNAEQNPKIKNICASDYPPPEGGSKSSISGWGSCYFELGTADKINQKFDFVMANILHNVLFDIMGDLKNLLNDEGYLSLSGILDEKKSVVLEAVERENLQIIDEIHQDQWVGYVVKLRN